MQRGSALIRLYFKTSAKQSHSLFHARYTHAGLPRSYSRQYIWRYTTTIIANMYMQCARVTLDGDTSIHLGSTRTVTNYAASITDKLDYLPYGEQIAGGSFTTHKFTGYDRDSVSGLDYANARYYSSSLGRFMSVDSAPGDVTTPQSFNRYAYVRNNPLALTDPSGNCSSDDPTCGGCDPIFGCGGGCDPDFGCGGGGGTGGGGRVGPQPPSYNPPNAGTSPNPPNGTLTSDDPFGGETNGIPNGLQISPVDPPGTSAGFIGLGDIVKWTLCGLVEPEVCAIIKVTAWGIGVYETIQLIHTAHSRSGHGRPGAEADDSPEAKAQYERDLETCRSLPNPAARSRCYESAENRRFAINHNRPIPPLITW